MMRSSGVSSRTLHPGFSLVELLVVIFIIGLLLAILLPAVQAAREAARQAQCKNNLKQLGLGIQNHAGANKALPVGAAQQGGSFGLSWLTDLLPHVEQQELYDGLDRISTGAGHPATPTNGPLARGKIITAFWCPTSPLPQLSSNQHLLPSYVGISGSTNEDGISTSLLSPCCTPMLNGGEISASGVFIPNQAITLQDIVDGQSNTMCVSELSDFAYAGAQPKNITGGFPTSWITGAAGVGTPPNYDPPTRRPCYNITTIKYAPKPPDFN